MELPGGVSPSYGFSMIEMVNFHDAVSYTIMCHNKRFIINVSAEHLEGEGGLVNKLYEFIETLDDDPDAMYDFEDWVLDPMDEHIKRLAPAPAPDSRTTLLQYYQPETYVFDMVNRNGVLVAIEDSYDPNIHGDSRPIAVIVDDDMEFSPNDTSTNTDTDPVTSELDRKRTIHRSALPRVPTIPASQLVRAAGPESIEEKMCEIPRIVRKVDTNQEYFFKAGDDRHGFRREVELLAKIENLIEHNPSLRTSRLVGLVHWDNDESLLMGMLIEQINGPTLHEVIRDASIADKRRWMDQVDETVNKLHEYGLVGGDVKPDNIMIDLSGDVVLVDFGGGCTFEYIDPELQETKEGDLQGLRKLRENILSDA